MAIKDLVPKLRHGRSDVAVRQKDWDPFRDFQREMNRMFDEFIGDFPSLANWKGGGALSSKSFSPAVDISESKKEIKVKAELPGMDEKDINVELDNSTIIISGEKHESTEDKDGKWHIKEQSYGSFQRIIPLPAAVDGSNVKAKFKKGVLTVVLPKLEDTSSNRRSVAIENG